MGNAKSGTNGPVDADAKLLPAPATALPGTAILTLECTPCPLGPLLYARLCSSGCTCVKPDLVANCSVKYFSTFGSEDDIATMDSPLGVDSETIIKKLYHFLHKCIKHGCLTNSLT